MRTAADPIRINRAPVLTLWATVVAERLGYAPETALTLGRFVASSATRMTARQLTTPNDASEIAERRESSPTVKEQRRTVSLLGRDVPILSAVDGTFRAVEQGLLLSAHNVQAYLASAFRERLADARSAMESLATSMPPQQLNRVGYRLYEFFRPDVVGSARPWDTKGELRIERIRGAIVATNQDDVPQTAEVERSILRLLAARTHPIKPADLYRPLADYMNLTPRQRALTYEGGTRSLWEGRVRSASTLLVKKGLMSREIRGLWTLTERGIDRAKSLEAGPLNAVKTL